MTTEGLKMT